MSEETEMFEPELGQALFSNTPWRPVEAERHVIAGIDLLDELIPADVENAGGGRTQNSGAREFDNGIFEMRSYCWCDGEGDHEAGCPPNFRYGDFEVCWYKHSHRGASQNRPMSLDEWHRVLTACLTSIQP